MFSPYYIDLIYTNYYRLPTVNMKPIKFIIHAKILKDQYSTDMIGHTMFNNMDTIRHPKIFIFELS